MEAGMSGPSSVNRAENRNILIRAGAGAGKTTRLIEEVYGYFKNYKQQKSIWPRIVLTTFSNKATQEINERLLKKAIQTYDAEFFEFINSKSHLLVSTIHGVLHQFIGQNQSEFGLTKDFKVVNDAEIQRRQQKLFRKLVSEDPEAAVLLDMYNLSELFSLVRDFRQLSLYAGALKPFSVDAFRKYTQGLASEFTKEFQVSIGVLRRSKLTATWANAIQSFPSVEGESSDIVPRLMEWEDQLPRIPTVSKTGDGDLVGAQTSFVSGIKKLREYVERNYHEEFFENFETMQSAFGKLANRYNDFAIEDLKESQEISISDIETLSFQALPEKKFLFQEFAKKWDFWMIDEFQDTSPIQIELLNNLIGESRSFFVGDPQQSIYYFRGSDSRVFESKMDEIKTSGQVEVLDNNYRSHKGVLDFINEFFSRQYSQFQKMTAIREKLVHGHDISVFEIGEKKDYAILTARQIAILIQTNPMLPLEDIVILSRTNKDLDDLAAELEILGVPHYVHSQGQFFKQREVLDLLFFVRFLIRPDDLNNLVFTLKTPMLGLTPDETKEVSRVFTSWEKLVQKRDQFSSRVKSEIEKLDRYLLKSFEIGIVETTQLYSVNEGAFVLNHSLDSSGKKESNIWKFFYWIRNELSQGMQHFLIQLDSVLDPNKNDMFEESETQAIVEPKKVQMMTIHASKGLQFGHVIVIGTHSPPRTRGRYSLDVDPESKEFSVFIKNKSKDDKIQSPIHWQQWAIQKERETEEFERLLYVALTRAKRNVSIFTGSKFSESTWSHKLQDFYSQYLMNKELMTFSMGWETLDPTNLLSESFTQSIKKGQAIPSSLNSELDSLTSFVEKLEDKMLPKELRGPLSFSSSKGFRQSTLNQVIISQKGIETHYRREKGIFDFSYYPKTSFEKEWGDIFNSGHREFRFTFQYGDFQIAGSMDFVFFSPGRILIVDYKSGRSTQDELYTEQLKFYAQCLMFIKKLKDTTVFDLVIDYVDQKKVSLYQYQPVAIGKYFDEFIQKRELENVGG